MAVQRGARVAVAAREQETLDRLSDEITSQGGEALAVAADVTRFDDIKSLAQRTIELEHSFYTEAATRPRLKRLLTMTAILGLGAVLLTKTRSSMA